MNIFEWNKDIPVTANNLNEMQNILNQNIIDKYSTEEKKTNKVWIDNKPIYRKVITITEFSSTEVNINTGLTNISEITSIDGSFNRAGYTRRYPIFNLFMNEWHIDIATGILTIKTNNEYVSFNGYMALEYTKTTD